MPTEKNKLAMEDAKRASTNDDAPPPYTETATSQPVASTSSASSAARRFPTAFNVYCKRMSGNLFIAEHQNQPLYFISRHSGWSGNPAVMLRSGPDKTSPVMATADYHQMGSRMKAQLPPLFGQGTELSQEEMRCKRNGVWSKYAFSVEVDASGKRENFEWRHSSGDAVGVLNADTRGWKLVRMETEAPASLGGEDAHFVDGGFRTSDGQEVVAVWSNVSVGGGNKVSKFMFMGTGASGLLGERWATMAVVTVLGIYDWEEDD